MRFNGWTIRYGTEWTPTLPLCTAHDQPSRLCRIRAAASAPLQPAQLAQDGAIRPNDNPLPRVLSSRVTLGRPTSPSEGKVEPVEPIPTTLPSHTIVESPLKGFPLKGVGSETITASPGSVGTEPAVAAEQPHGPPAPGARSSSRARAVETPAAELTATEYTSPSVQPMPTTTAVTLSNVMQRNPHAGASSSTSFGRHTNTSTSRDAEALIRAITSRDLLQHLQPQQQQPDAADDVPDASCSTGLHGSGGGADGFPAEGYGTASAPPLAQDLASLLSALDGLPGIEDGSTRSMVSEPFASLPDGRVLLGPGGIRASVGEPGDPLTRPGSQSLPQHFPIPEALKGLFTVIAPASPLTLQKGEHSGGSALPYGPRRPLPPAPQPGAHLQSAAGPAVVAVMGTATSCAASAAGTPVAEARRAPENGIGDTARSPLGSLPNQHQLQQQDQQRRDERPAVGPTLRPTSITVALDPTASAALLYAAAGVALPPMLPPPAAGLRLDPSLEWALGLLSTRVTSRHPRHGEVRLANRILAAHLGPPRRLPAPAAAVASVVVTAPATLAATTAAVAGAAEAPGASGVGDGGGWNGRPDALQRLRMTLPWPLMLPVLDAVASRLSPPAALALLRVISRQVGPKWRQELGPRDQAQLVATLRMCFRAALRSPDAVSASAAAGLMEVMCRLQVRSEPACALLVARILTGLVPIRRALAPPQSHSSPSLPLSSASALSRPPPSSSSSAAAVAAQSSQLPSPSSPQTAAVATSTTSPSTEATTKPSKPTVASVGMEEGADQAASCAVAPSGGSASELSPPACGAAHKGQRVGGSNSSSSRRAQIAGRRVRWSGLKNAAARRVLGRTAGAARYARGRSRDSGGGGVDGGGRLLMRMGFRWRRAQLRWACVAMSTLARLRISRFSLPRRALTKLLWAALFAAAYWTPGIAAALPVWAARLECPPPAAFLRHYSRVLLATSRSPVAAATRGGRGQLQPSQPRGHRRLAEASVRKRKALPAAAAATRCAPRATLVDRMSAPQLAAALEALVSHYGPCTATPEAVVAAVTDAAASGRAYRSVGHMFASCSSIGNRSSDEGSSSKGGSSNRRASGKGRRGSNSSSSGRLALRYTGYRDLMHTLVRALFRRLRQLRWQQLCRLPLLLHSVGQPSEVADVEAARARWQQVFVHQIRRLLPSCDVVDIMLLLRGLAAGSSASAISEDQAECMASGGPRSTGTRMVPQPYTYEWMGAQLADDALRRYTVLLPAATLYHTAAVLESLSLLWAQPAQLTTAVGASLLPPGSQQNGRSGAASPPALLPPRTTATGHGRSSPPARSAPPQSASSSTAAAAAAAVPASSHYTPISPEEDLHRRRLADLALERDFLLQQLDEHVALCLSYSSGGGGRPGHGRGQASHQDRRAQSPRGRVALGLLVKILTAYSRLQRPPAPRLQGALEAALLERTQCLGTQGWQAVRSAYQQLRLQPGPELSVALIMFG